MNATDTSKTLALTVQEAAQELRIGPTKAWALIRSGEIPSFKIGGHRRVLRADLESYLKNLARVTPQAETADLS